MLRFIRNPLAYAAGTTIPGAIGMLLLALPEVGSWDLSAGLIFVFTLFLYVGLYALAAFVSFALASLVLRRFGSVERRRLLQVGFLVSATFIAVGFASDPLGSEQGFILAWVVLTFVGALISLLSWAEQRDA